MDSPMSGIFNAPNNRFRPPQPQNGQPTAPAPTNDSSTGRIMPPGNAMMAPQSAQNSFMPQGSPMGPGQSGSGMPTPQPMNLDDQQPMTAPSFNARAPIMDPNNNFKLDALKAGVLNDQSPITSVGTPTQNTPSTNMQHIPFLLNQLRMGANAPGM